MPSKACLRLTVPPLPSRYLNSICSSSLPNSTRSLIFWGRLSYGASTSNFAHRAAGEGQMRIGDDLLGIEEILRPETVAARTGADRTVEGEESRLELGER